MTQFHDTFWQTPAVRHLAWLCQAPSLICQPTIRPLSAWLPGDTFDRLQALDRQPAPLLTALNRSQSHRLGHYFEALYAFLLEWLLEWPIILRNAAIRADDGHTLGELDFIVHNPVTKEFEHHEIAVKFYLGLVQDGQTLWFGPNARDRLDLKAGRMTSHQLTMTQRPETRKILTSHGVNGSITPVLTMPGYLFRPLSPELPESSDSDYINPHHETGRWLYHSQLDQVNTEHWTQLRKPHWLGPYQQRQAEPAEHAQQALKQIPVSERPALFANMGRSQQGEGLVEVERWFVVPDSWPGQG
ncbi:DUF1853 family protein [Marinobacter zhejiangensis]|uniref:DUF1853 domain-containing protein n=1 Tax=Marinobacter zhejiangensis TaxID=488535 RepID=A0A1I4NGM1_9GAMM|nr:DUF1853 family protein [Marinobacter zhejiangensis]SFM14648.1 hypothetical protein SAMN04487963_1384 [Marinobacter zhejiangensis]